MRSPSVWAGTKVILYEEPVRVAGHQGRVALSALSIHLVVILYGEPVRVAGHQGRFIEWFKHVCC